MRIDGKFPIDEEVNRKIRKTLYEIKNNPDKVLEVFDGNPDFYQYTHYKWFNKTSDGKNWYNSILHEILVFSIDKDRFDIINGYIESLKKNNIIFNEYDYTNSFENGETYISATQSPILFSALRCESNRYSFEKSKSIHKTIESLVDFGFDPSVYDEKNRNVLMILGENVPHHSLVRKILDSGAIFPGTDGSNHQGYILNVIAYTEEGKQDIASIKDILKSYGKEHPSGKFDTSILKLMQYVDRPEIFNALISSEINPAGRSIDNLTIFDSKKPSCAEYIEILIDVNPAILKTIYKDKSTPLSRSLLAKNDNLSALLISKGLTLENTTIMGISAEEYIESSSLEKTRSVIRAMQAKNLAAEVANELRDGLSPQKM